MTPIIIVIVFSSLKKHNEKITDKPKHAIPSNMIGKFFIIFESEKGCLAGTNSVFK